MAAYVYSLSNVVAAIAGPNGNISIGAGAGVAEEGIEFEMAEEANKMVTGADGTPMHSLNPAKSGKVRVRLLKISPTNQLLEQMYNAQRTSSALWGQNTISINDVVRGDAITARQVAFTKFPKTTYKKEGDMLEWEFDAGFIDPTLGSGS